MICSLTAGKSAAIFTIIGAGMGTADTLTGEAVRALETAEAVFATKRLAALSPKAEVCAFSELAERANSAQKAHILLVSGDVDSSARRKAARAAPAVRRGTPCRDCPVWYMCAKCGISYENLCFKSLHGRTGNILGAVSYHAATFVLTGGENNAQAVCNSLTRDWARCPFISGKISARKMSGLCTAQPQRSRSFRARI
ncbi:MAG: hypothetical protein ACLT4C_00265 [Butyricicoccus sp.]